MKLFFAFLFLTSAIRAQVPAFPGAEGGGMHTTGGRGGKVYEVTSLSDSGPGSLREAVSATGPRIVVFRISGTIELKSELRITKPDITIAGQSAPGDGICISSYPLYISASNVIIRYMRIRLGDINRLETDAFSAFSAAKNIIVDHCSVSWSVDEAASLYDNENLTMQWCIISESLYKSYHSKGSHGYGGIWGGSSATFHHNLLAHHSSRNPRFNGGRTRFGLAKEYVDFVNNVIYNWGFNSSYGGEEGNHNVRLNYYKYGPATSPSVKNRILDPSDTSGNWFVSGNYVFGYPAVTADNWNGGVQGNFAAYQKTKKANAPFPYVPVTTQAPEAAFELVLNNAGCSFPRRDPLDERIVMETRTGTASCGATYGGGKKGIIDSQTDAGSWPVLNTLPASMDSDHDGMPDDYERANGLNPQNSEDRNLLNWEGYTALEVYLNGLVKTTADIKKDENYRPEGFIIYPNYPNPFNPETVIQFSLPASAVMKVKIFDAKGSLVENLSDGLHPQGMNRLVWRGTDSSGSKVPSGIYLCAFYYANRITTQKIMMIK